MEGGRGEERRGGRRELGREKGGNIIHITVIHCTHYMYCVYLKDFHSHLALSEVVGYLGGQIKDDPKGLCIN